MSTRCLRFTASVLVPVSFFAIFTRAQTSQTQAASSQSGFIDNFSHEVSLDTSLWTTESDLLRRVASVGEGGNQCFSLANSFMQPALNFGPNGMQMSGANAWQQFTGIQSLKTLVPPFTLRTTVKATVANGNAFEIFLVSSDSTQWFSLYGNVNPSNWPNHGINLGCDLFYARTAVGISYTIDVSANVDGIFSVSLSSGSVALAKKSLHIGTGPFYLVLGQGEGWPNTGGTKNVALWQSVSATFSQAQVASNPTPSAANKFWVAQVNPSIGQGSAGQITLEWNAENSTSCKLTVTPSIQNLAQNASVPVPCTGVGTNWTGSLPSNLPTAASPMPNPVPYTFGLRAIGSTGEKSYSLTVYALPTLIYGGGALSGTAFNSLTNSQPYSTKQLACALELGCAIDFGLTGSQLGSSSQKQVCVTGSAECDGFMLAGVIGWGGLGSVGADYDSLMAQYGPFQLTEYTEYIAIQPQVGVVSISACKAFEGGAGTQYFIQMSDTASNNYSWSPQNPEDCTALLSGPLGSAIQQAWADYQDWTQLEQDVQPIIRDQVSSTEQLLQASSQGFQILQDLGDLAGAGSLINVSVTAQSQSIVPCTNAALKPCTPLWLATINSSTPYDIIVSVGAALVSIGANGAGILVVGHSQISVGGLAVPPPTSIGST